MKKPLCSVIVIGLFIPSLSFSRSVSIQWTRAFGGPDLDCGYCVQETEDGGYIIVGHTWSYGAGGSDVWLIKTNSVGDIMWFRTYGGEGSESGYYVGETSDGGYLITGCVSSLSMGEINLLIIKTNSSGDKMWDAKLKSSGKRPDFFIQETKDDNFVIVGSTRFGKGENDVQLVKIKPSGDTLWSRKYGGPGNDVGNYVWQTKDSGYIIAGYTDSFGAGKEDVWLIRTDSLGDTLWTRTYGGKDCDRAKFVKQTEDGGYIVTGWTESFGAGKRDVLFMRLSSD